MTLQIRVDNQVPPVLVGLEDMARRLTDDPGIVEHHVESTEGVQRRVHHDIHSLSTRHVGLEADGISSSRADHGSNRFCRRPVDIGDCHLRSLLGIALGNGAADAAPGAGHDCNLALQAPRRGLISHRDAPFAGLQVAGACRLTMLRGPGARCCWRPRLNGQPMTIG